MDCPDCSTPQSDAARFCERCGTPMYAAVDRSNHFVADPDEPVIALTLISTLMPHLSGRRHQLYRNVINLMLLAALLAAAFGSLALALVLAAIALPIVMLVYIHDHDVWGGEPVTLVGVGVVLSLVLGVAVGLLQTNLNSNGLLAATTGQAPSVNTIGMVGLAVPLVTYVALLVGPLIMTTRPQFRHPVDEVVVSTLAGAALSLGLSVVVQQGAFTHVMATSGNPAQVAFIALTLGFLQPIVFASATAIAVIRLREPNLNKPAGIALGLALVVGYELAATLLAPYGAKGIVVTTFVALLLAGAGLVGTRQELHNALIAEAKLAATGGQVARAADVDQRCAHCAAELGEGAAFCTACGTHSATLARPGNSAEPS
jgi:hypothetical protein